jgi:hypothetical protein
MLFPAFNDEQQSIQRTTRLAGCVVQTAGVAVATPFTLVAVGPLSRLGDELKVRVTAGKVPTVSVWLAQVMAV